MIISKIYVQNYKLLKEVCFDINPDINVFVGENDAGKSTLLEVISILPSGKLNGYAIQKQIKDNLFNSEVRTEYIQSLSGKAVKPPKIIMEAYCGNGDEAYSGTNNVFGENCAGIRVEIEFDNQYKTLYEKMLSSGDIKDIPVEFYHAVINYFSGDPVFYRNAPIKATYVDTTRKDYTGLVDRFVSENITQYLSESDQVDLSLVYRKVRNDFKDSEIVAKLNGKLIEDKALNGKNVSIELKEGEVDEWKRQMAISVENIPFDQIGFGSQNIIKVELAIKNDSNNANLILLEEPENCLSYTNMSKLIHRIASSGEKQIFISTHSSFIANKLNLDKILLVEKGMVKPFREIPESTVTYFKKLPGYDTLRLVLAERVVLVEGPTDDLIIQKAYKEKHDALPIDNGIDIIVVDSLAFKRYCDIAIAIKKEVAVVTDNDGNIKSKIMDKYADYKDNSYIHLFYEKDESLKTIEPSVLAVNCDSNGEPTESFKTIISKNDSLDGRDYDGVLSFMSNNKSEWALRVFDSDSSINYPKYIEELLDEYC